MNNKYDILFTFGGIAFGQPFDEIVVESSLTVKRKSGERQSKSPSLTPNEKTVLKRTRRHLASYS